MNQIAELLSPESILLDLDATTKARLFEAVGAALAAHLGGDAGAKS